jgi:hypothetical protein
MGVTAVKGCAMQDSIAIWLGYATYVLLHVAFPQYFLLVFENVE